MIVPGAEERIACPGRLKIGVGQERLVQQAVVVQRRCNEVVPRAGYAARRKLRQHALAAVLVVTRFSGWENPVFVDVIAEVKDEVDASLGVVVHQAAIGAKEAGLI